MNSAREVIGNILGHGHIKEHKELSEGGLVHAGDHRHVSDEEVEDGAPRGHWTVLFTCTIDLALSL